ncbi:MAG: TonB-dependent receptor [Pseudomonadota bacterium]
MVRWGGNTRTGEFFRRDVSVKVATVIVAGVVSAFLFHSPADAALSSPQHADFRATGEQMPLIRIAQSARRFQIDIPPQPLASALEQLNRQTGAQFAYPSSFAGIDSSGARGELSVDEALESVLRNTQAQVKKVGPNTMAIRLAQATTDSQSDANEISLDVIIVEGELLDRDVQKTTTSVVVIQGDDIERRGESSIEDIIERTPGLSRAQGNNELVIRGIAEGGVGSAGTGKTITTTVDGIRTTNFGNMRNNILSTWDLEQVEVLRGPQSTQSGRNALAGAVNIQSKNPTYEPEFKTRGLAGNADTLQGSVVANVPIIEDVLAIRMAFDHIQSDGFIDNPVLGIDDFAATEDTTLRIGTRLDLSDDFSAVFKFTSYDQSGTNNPQVEESLFPGARVNLGDELVPVERSLQGYNLNLDYQLTPNVSLKSETTYSMHEFFNGFDLDFGPFVVPLSEFDGTDEVLEQQVKLVYDTESLKAVLGGFYTTIEREDDFVSSGLPAFFFDPFANPASTVATSAKSGAETVNYAVFGEAEIEVVDSLTAIVGLRYDKESVEENLNTSFSSDDLAVALPPDADTIIDAEFEALLPKFGVVYELSDDASLGFTVQRGYRAGGADVTLAGLVPYDPEFTWNYELALRSRWLDNKLTVNANAFYTSWTDQQLLQPTGSGFPNDNFVVNAGSSRLWGAELEVRGEPMEGLELFGSVAYVNTEFTDFIFDGVQVAGNKFPYASDISASVGANLYLENGIVAGLDLNYTSDGYTDVLNTPSEKFDDRLLLNARIGYRADKWSVSVFAKNLLNEQYITRREPGFSTVEVGDPREFGVVLQGRL